MKTKILSLAILSLWSVTSIFAQDRTTVTATNSDISDNLDLRAVASIFGDSADLVDFERRLNDPKTQISNLDLNGDNQVDYLRVIETVEGNSHLIVIQSVLGRDTFQDIATIQVEKDRNNQIQVQVVGDVYMYGNNYIYEPVYSYNPVIYNSFWVGNYNPYYSSWYWGYYPSYYYYWAPYPVYTYHNNIIVHINTHHHYNYVNTRRNTVIYNNYYNGRRQNAYEQQYPTRTFVQRNTGYSNRRELDNRAQPGSTRSQTTYSGTRNTTNETGSPRPVRTNGTKAVIRQTGTRSTEPPRTTTTPRSTIPQRNDTPRTPTVPRNESPRTPTGTRNTSIKSTEMPNVETPRSTPNRSNESPRVQIQRAESTRNSNQTQRSEPKTNSSRSDENSRIGRR